MELITRLKISPADMFSDTDDLSLIDKLRAEVEAEAKDLERYEIELKRYNKL